MQVSYLQFKGCRLFVVPCCRLTSLLSLSSLTFEHLPGQSPSPLEAFERLFFALFGLTKPSDLKFTNNIEEWTINLFKLVFGLYLLLTAIVLINLLIAMMSDTYQVWPYSLFAYSWGKTSFLWGKSSGRTPVPLNQFHPGSRKLSVVKSQTEENH